MMQLQIHRGWMVERMSAAWVARHPLTAGLLVEPSGMVGRFATADQACEAIDRQMSPAFTYRLPRPRSARLYS